MASNGDTQTRSHLTGILMLGALCVGAALWLINHNRRREDFDAGFDTPNDLVVAPTSLGETTAYADSTAGTLPYAPEETPVASGFASADDIAAPTGLGLTGVYAERLRGEAPDGGYTPEPETPDTAAPAPNDATVDAQPLEDNLGPENAELRAREFPVEAEADVYRADILQQHNDSTDGSKFAAGGEPGEKTGDRQPLGEVPNIMDQDELVPDFRQQR